MGMSASGLQDQFNGIVVRSYADADCGVVGGLFSDGLLAGQIPVNDTGDDIEDVPGTYLTDEGNHFWVAQIDGRARGMIGVVRRGDHVGEIRRLRVEKGWQDSPVAARLVEAAIEHCRHHGFLKVVFNTRYDSREEPGAVEGLFDRFAFQHTRTKNVQGKELLEFYLDLYRDPQQP